VVQAHFDKTGPYGSADSNTISVKGKENAPVTQPLNRELTLEITADRND
jgi:hypothetical protein